MGHRYRAGAVQCLSLGWWDMDRSNRSETRQADQEERGTSAGMAAAPGSGEKESAAALNVELPAAVGSPIGVHGNTRLAQRSRLVPR